MSKFDFEEMRKAIDTICDGKVFEVRALLKRGDRQDRYFRDGTYLGYFDSFDQVKTALTPFEGCHGNFYFTIQELKEELSSREQYNKFVCVGKNEGTKDGNVKRYRWLFIDFDPDRTSGISATDIEKAKAVAVAQAVYDKLRLLGWGDPIICDSGNGCHIHYMIDLENTPENSDLIKAVLNTLDVLFSTKDVKVDTGNFNASRICKLYGTLAMKGRNSDDRPHRMSKILMIPEHMTTISAKMLHKVVGLIPAQKKAPRDYTGQKTDFEELFNRWGVEYVREDILNKNTNEMITKYVFPVDPLNPEHNTSCSALFVFENGYPYFKCFHNTCTHTWADIYKHYEHKTWDFGKSNKAKKEPLKSLGRKDDPIEDETTDVIEGGYHEPNFDYNQDGTISKTIRNITEAIEYDRDLYGRIKYNTLSYSPCIVGGLPWDKNNIYREWKNSDDANLRSYLEDQYGFKQKERIYDGLSIIVDRNRFNPVVEELKIIHGQWDGKTGHVRKLLTDYLGCEDNEYHYQVIKTFMLGAVKRVFQPGCKFDYMIIIYGDQGIGKSTFLKRLALKDDWYLDNLNTVEGDKASEKIRGFWIVEIAELSALKKQKGNETIKAFVTSEVDSFRLPYERRTEKFPRVCVFAGTTNDEGFLTDRTGNRRFLPITANKNAIRKDIFNRDDYIPDFTQAWAEIMDIYLADPNATLTLGKDIQAFAEAEQERYMMEDVRVGEIQDWLDSYSGEYVCLKQIWKNALGHQEDLPRYEANELAKIMKHSIKGWKRLDALDNDGRPKKKSIPGYGQQRVYERTEEYSDCTDSPF